MNVPFLDLQAQYRSIKAEVDPAIHAILDSSAYILGPAVEAFEKEYAAFIGVKHCIALNSGTAAIALLLQAYDIGPGDEVITVANSFFASVEGIAEIGAKSVLVDCDEQTALIDTAKIEAAITSKTKAILPVHLYGQPAPMDEILAIARKHKILVLEDAAQSQGAMYKGKRAGSLGDSACTSFYPGKNLGAYGDAGAVLTNDDEVARKMKMLREHGSPKKYFHDVIGWNERMDGIQGAVLGVKLKHLDIWNAARRKNAALYQKLLAGAPNIGLIVDHPGCESIYHLFVVRVQNREKVQAELSKNGIGTGIHYPNPLHLLPACASLGYKMGDFPATEILAKEILSLPMFAELTAEQITYVADTLKKIVA
jgi:dTDP-4-amino-4,6-dideoxygalactose transaminase